MFYLKAATFYDALMREPFEIIIYCPCFYSHLLCCLCPCCFCFPVLFVDELDLSKRYSHDLL